MSGHIPIENYSCQSAVLIDLGHPIFIHFLTGPLNEEGFISNMKEGGGGGGGGGTQLAVMSIEASNMCKVLPQTLKV